MGIRVCGPLRTDRGYCDETGDGVLGNDDSLVVIVIVIIISALPLFTSSS